MIQAPSNRGPSKGGNKRDDDACVFRALKHNARIRELQPNKSGHNRKKKKQKGGSSPMLEVLSFAAISEAHHDTLKQQLAESQTKCSMQEAHHESAMKRAREEAAEKLAEANKIIDQLKATNQMEKDSVKLLEADNAKLHKLIEKSKKQRTEGNTPPKQLAASTASSEALNPPIGIRFPFGRQHKVFTVREGIPFTVPFDIMVAGEPVQVNGEWKEIDGKYWLHIATPDLQAATVFKFLVQKQDPFRNIPNHTTCAKISEVIYTAHDMLDPDKSQHARSDLCGYQFRYSGKIDRNKKPHKWHSQHLLIRQCFSNGKYFLENVRGEINTPNDVPNWLRFCVTNGKEKPVASVHTQQPQNLIKHSTKELSEPYHVKELGVTVVEATIHNRLPIKSLEGQWVIPGFKVGDAPQPAYFWQVETAPDVAIETLIEILCELRHPENQKPPKEIFEPMKQNEKKVKNNNLAVANIAGFQFVYAPSDTGNSNKCIYFRDVFANGQRYILQDVVCVVENSPTGLLCPTWQGDGVMIWNCFHRRNRIVAVDLDETTGSWGPGSVAHKIWAKLGGTKESFVEPFIKYYVKNGGARPELDRFLRCLQMSKDKGLIDSVAIFTSAENQHGWVDFLKTCMETYAGTPGLFGTVIYREISLKANQASVCQETKRTFKDCNLLRKEPSDVVALVDDQIAYCKRGYPLQVPEYHKRVDLTDLIEFMSNEFPSRAGDITQAFETDAQKYPVKDTLNDNAFEACMSQLGKVFPSRYKQPNRPSEELSNPPKRRQKETPEVAPPSEAQRAGEEAVQRQLGWIQ